MSVVVVVVVVVLVGYSGFIWAHCWEQLPSGGGKQILLKAVRRNQKQSCCQLNNQTAYKGVYTTSNLFLITHYTCCWHENIHKCSLKRMRTYGQKCMQTSLKSPQPTTWERVCDLCLSCPTNFTPFTFMVKVKANLWVQRQIPVTFPARMRWMPWCINQIRKMSIGRCRAIRGRPGCFFRKMASSEENRLTTGVSLDQSDSRPASPGDRSFFNPSNRVCEASAPSDILCGVLTHILLYVPPKNRKHRHSQKVGRLQRLSGHRKVTGWVPMKTAKDSKLLETLPLLFLVT